MHASSDHCSSLNFVLFCEILKCWDERKDGRTDVQTTRVKLVITTDRDYGLASWINIVDNEEIEQKKKQEEKKPNVFF